MHLRILLLFLPSLNLAMEDDVWDPTSTFGGHSREFRSIDEAVDWQSLVAVPESNGRWTRDTHRLSDEEIQQFISAHRSSYNAAIGYLKQLFDGEWVSIVSRIKSFSSLKEKLQRKDYPLERIRDVIGIRLTFQTVSEVRKAKELLEKNSTQQFAIQEVRCYGICKEAIMNYTESGYRRIHLLAYVLPEKKWAEIQLGTPYTNLWSDWNHDFLYKGSFSKTQKQDVTNYMLDVGEYLYQLDEARNNMPPCPGILQTTKAKDAMTDIAYEMLHQPPNLCLNWNDIFISQPIMKPEPKVSTNSRAPLSTALFPWAFLVFLL